MITVKFACGHQVQVGESQAWQPVCATCGETHVARVQARPPRFVGTVSGPYCETKGLEPGIVNVAPGGALNLKVQE